jgi:hypothetical protein
MLGFSFCRTSILAPKMGNANLLLLMSALALQIVRCACNRCHASSDRPRLRRPAETSWCQVRRCQAGPRNQLRELIAEADRDLADQWRKTARQVEQLENEQPEPSKSNYLSALAEQFKSRPVLDRRRSSPIRPC